MWVVFGDILIKIAATWFTVSVALLLWGLIQALVTQDIELEDTLVSMLFDIWGLLGLFCLIMSGFALVIMIIINIWN